MEEILTQVAKQLLGHPPVPMLPGTTNTNIHTNTYKQIHLCKIKIQILGARNKQPINRMVNDAWPDKMKATNQKFTISIDSERQRFHRK